MRAVCLLISVLPAFAQSEATKAPTDIRPGSITYEDVEYPYPVSYLPLTMYGQDVRMAYMDVPPAGQPNGRTVMLFHGMNFGGFYFAGPIDVLRREGFRVVVPDQIGFGRSSKPIIPYNFHDMALNSRRLLESLGISKVTIVGHSMGGMLSARFAASFPDITERAVIYDPIGLTDPRYERPWRSADEGYKAILSQTNDQRWQGFYANIRRYFPSPGAWKPEYEKYVRILYAPTLSGDWPRLAMVRSIYQQMLYLDPVVYDWAKIKVKTLVIGGEKDGQDFPALAKHIADSIPGAQLVILPNAGHAGSLLSATAEVCAVAAAPLPAFVQAVARGHSNKPMGGSHLHRRSALWRKKCASPHWSASPAWLGPRPPRVSKSRFPQRTRLAAHEQCRACPHDGRRNRRETSLTFRLRVIVVR